MTVSSEISEADVARVTPGQKVYFTTLGDPNKRHYAELRAIEPAPASIESETRVSTGTAVYYNGLFDVDNSDGSLRTGMTAQVYIVLRQAENVLALPAAALGAATPDGRRTVQIVNRSGDVETRTVSIGLNNSVLAEVKDGLREGEQVVIAQSGEASAMTSRQPGRFMMGGPGGGPAP
jgi:macrolide-specific efflux system membrane fusion protein